jgi:hypothetical protein
VRPVLAREQAAKTQIKLESPVMEQSDSQSTLRDNLLALPIWAVLIALSLPAIGVAVGFILLLTPHLVQALRIAGGQLLVVSLPVLALAVGLLGATRAGTERIDVLTATFLRRTIGSKLETYLVTPEHRGGQPTPYQPLFVRMERSFRKNIASFCYYHLFDDRDRPFDITVKSNVFNFEVTFFLHLVASPPGLTSAMCSCVYHPDSLKDWSGAIANPLVELVALTLQGTLAEGYTVLVHATVEEGGGLRIRYQLRQKPQANFLTSPYLRRYFSEDAAIASYFFYAEAFANGKTSILNGAAF